MVYWPIHAQYSEWDNVFYLFGCLAILWFFFWTSFCFSFPHHHPRISESELRYLESQTEVQQYRNTLNEDNASLCSSGPSFRKIFSNPPFWGMLVAHLGNRYAQQSNFVFLSLFSIGLRKYGKLIISLQLPDSMDEENSIGFFYL